MPPKKNISKQLSDRKRVLAHSIPIFEILSTKEIREPLNDILPQVETVLKQDPVHLKVSLLSMLVRICGLEEYASNIDVEDTLGSLQKIIEKASEVRSVETYPLITLEKDKFHKEFTKRLSEFVRGVISDELQVFNDQKLQFNQSFLSWLQILTKTQLRSVRNASMRFTQILLQEEIGLYDFYHEKRQSKKAFTISKSISLYLEKIVSPRFTDVDKSIRERAFETAGVIMEQLEGEVMSEQLLHMMFTPLFEEKVEVIDLFVKLVLKLMEKCKDPTVLVDYLKENTGHLTELSKNTQFTHANMTAFRIIQKLHQLDPTLRLMNHDFMVSMLQTYASQNLLYALYTISEVFYHSLYKTPLQLEANSAIVLLEIINLAMAITNQKCLNLILIVFFQSNKKIDPYKIFNIDNMFNLLLSETYRNERNVDVKLKQKEVSTLLAIIIGWIKYITKAHFHNSKDKLIYEKMLESYNSHILVNCKRLIFEKIMDHEDFAEKYLSLFAHLHTPTLVFGQIENYLDFVCEKATQFFGQNLVNTKIYIEIVKLLYNVCKDDKIVYKFSSKDLISKLPLLEMTRQEGSVTTQNIYRVCAIFHKFPIQELTTSHNFMMNLIEAFIKSESSSEKSELISIFHYVHHYNFIELFENASESHLQVYKKIRGTVLKMYLEIIDNTSESISVRITAFRALVFMLKTVLNKKFQENIGRANSFTLNNDEMKIIYEFITRELFDSNSSDYTSMDITRMVERMTFESHLVKMEIIKFVFDLFENSYFFACHPESVKFLIKMIKTEDDFHRQFSVRSLSLPMSIELIQKMEGRLKNLLEFYFNEEVKESNTDKLIYWRLCIEIFTHSREDQKFNVVLEKMLSTYFSRRKNDSLTKEKAITKSMLFVIQAVERILERQDYIQLDIYEEIFRKISKKIPKTTLIRVKEYLIEKSQGISSHYVQSFLETLERLAKTHKKAKDEVKDEEESEKDDGEESKDEDEDEVAKSEESDDQNQRRGTKKKSGTTRKNGGKTKSKKEPVENIEEVGDYVSSNEEEEPVQKGRVLRSYSKKKQR